MHRNAMGRETNCAHFWTLCGKRECGVLARKWASAVETVLPTVFPGGLCRFESKAAVENVGVSEATRGLTSAHRGGGVVQRDEELRTDRFLLVAEQTPTVAESMAMPPGSACKKPEGHKKADVWA